MKTNSKNSQKAQEAKKTTFPCVDLKFEGNTSIIKEGEKRIGTLICTEQDEKFRFRERGVERVLHPELHWRLLDRTKHGRMHINSQHVKVEFYIRHGDYKNGRDLADILANEIEIFGESLSDMDMEEEVSACC